MAWPGASCTRRQCCSRGRGPVRRNSLRRWPAVSRAETADFPARSGVMINSSVTRPRERVCRSAKPVQTSGEARPHPHRGGLVGRVRPAYAAQRTDRRVGNIRQDADAHVVKFKQRYGVSGLSCPHPLHRSESSVFLALRDLRFARGRFALMGAVVALIAVLGVLLSGLASGLADAGISGLRALPVTHMAFDEKATSEQFSRSTVEQEDWQAWSEAPGWSGRSRSGTPWPMPRWPRESRRASTSTSPSSAWRRTPPWRPAPAGVRA